MSDQADILVTKPADGMIIFSKFHEDRRKIMDFLLIDIFYASALFSYTLSRYAIGCALHIKINGKVEKFGKGEGWIIRFLELLIGKLKIKNQMPNSTKNSRTLKHFFCNRHKPRLVMTFLWISFPDRVSWYVLYIPTCINISYTLNIHLLDF